MKRKIVINFVVLIALITSMIIYYQHDIATKDRVADLLKEDYPFIGVRDNANGVVSEISHPYPEKFKDLPHQAFVLLKDSIKRRIRTGYELNGGFTLDSILNVGDYVLKKSGSDTLFVYKIRGRDSTMYCFQLHDDLGYPLKQRYRCLGNTSIFLLSSVLNSERAIQVNIQIMRIYSKLKGMIMDHNAGSRRSQRRHREHEVNC